jgi:DNA-directed RNA polymerase subunit RPC12/RpoP
VFWCEKCQKASARKAWECRSCETVFVPTNKHRQGESSVSCPQCGSRQVGIAEKGARPRRTEAEPSGADRPESPHASAVPGRGPD